MTLRSGHGDCKGTPRIEVMAADEALAGVQAPARPAPGRDAAGRLLKGASASEFARQGGIAARESKQLARLMGLQEFDESHPWHPYYQLARSWRDSHMATLAETIGGGVVGPGPASIVSSASLQLAASRYLSDQGALNGDAKLLLDASRLSDASRQNLLAAHELVAREAKARPRSRAEMPDFVQDAMNNQAKGRK